VQKFVLLSQLKTQFKEISVFNWESNKYLKKYADNKALRGNSPQTPMQRLDCGELRQCHRC
jgi:hypothetical protein